MRLSRGSAGAPGTSAPCAGTPGHRYARRRQPDPAPRHPQPMSLIGKVEEGGIGMENKTPLLLIASLPAFVFPAAYAENVYVYVDPLPPWADYASNVMYLSQRHGKRQIPVWNSINLTIPQVLILLYNGFETLVESTLVMRTANQFIEVGLGDSNCGSQWNPYSERHISHIMQHEIGHIFGHEHNDDPNSIMYPIALNREYGLVEETYRLAEGYGQLLAFVRSKI